MTEVEAFSALRPRLFSIAYRMLGVRADAEDVVQDAWLRWSDRARPAVQSGEAWLVSVVTRLSIDRLRAAGQAGEAAPPIAPLGRGGDLPASFAQERMWRMQVAQVALADGDATVGELADRLGYRSEAAFARAFKRVIGLPPGAARRQGAAA